MNSWKVISSLKKYPKFHKPIFIEGLPGIGNVGKITADFLIEELEAIKLCEFFSFTLPNSVFVNEKNLIELPSIKMYYKKFKNNKNDLLILSGDVQPAEEVSSYELCETILDFLSILKISEIITLGGVGLQVVPKNPKIYCTGNDTKIIEKYQKNTKMINKIYGIVGPIMGASGLLLGLSKTRNIPAITLLAETYGHPMYFGINGAREIILVLNKKFQLNLNVKKIDGEVKKVEKEIVKRTEEIETISKKGKKRFVKELTYIG